MNVWYPKHEDLIRVDPDVPRNRLSRLGWKIIFRIDKLGETWQSPQGDLVHISPSPKNSDFCRRMAQVVEAIAADEHRYGLDVLRELIQETQQRMPAESVAPLLHVHAQNAWHDPAFLLGDRTALQKLRDLLDAVLAGGATAQKTDFIVADGEHYDVCVAMENARWQSPAWIHAAVPYQSDAARERSSEAIHPAARKDVAACLQPTS